ncbi:tetratricopeptide repeat protein [Mucilaginibacter ximonensis]|uniref:histidine kinase n=1 Tax=Mucilaginibacter ximonensis TaxID=538021 RepID=A0ABW5Y6G6_9SPHI
MLAKQSSPRADSLQRLVATALSKNAGKPDTSTIQQINKLAKEYFLTNPDSALYYSKLQINLSKKINFSRGIADGLSQIAAVNTFRGNYIGATKNYNTALNIYLQLADYKGIGKCYDGLGRIQDFYGKYDEAINLYKKGLVYFLKTPDDTDEGECYNNMGITYDSKGDLSKALDFYFKALLINIKHNDQNAAATKYSNIGIIMQELELYPKALAYYQRALAIWEKTGDKQGISTANQNIGDLYIVQKNYEQGKPYIDRAYRIIKQLNDTEGLALVYFDLGLYNYSVKRVDSTIYYLKQSLKLADQNKMLYAKAYALIGLAKVYNWLKDYRQAHTFAVQAKESGKQLKSLIVETDASEQLSLALAGLKRFKEAFHEHVIFSNLRSDLKHNESIHKAMFYNLELDFAKKQRELADNQHRKEEAYKKRIAKQSDENLISAGIIVVLAIVVLIYYNAKRKQQHINLLLAEKNREIITQQASLNTQADKLNELNSLKDRLIGVLAHDLRAPISTLRGLFTLMTDDNLTGEEFIAMTPKVFNKLENTSDFLDTLLYWINSQVDGKINNIVSFSMSKLVSRELQHIEDKLQQKNITVQLDIPTDVVALADPNSVRIVIHNLLTNAIKFSNRDGRIDISAWINNGEVNFCLKDYGVGMSAEYLNNLFKSHVTSSVGTENEVGTGMGLLFSRDLIEKQKGRIWASSVLGTGTELCFTLPVGDKIE